MKINISPYNNFNTFGPAGVTAAIYAARAGLKPVLIAPAMGGQLMSKGVNVENYPGLTELSGGDIIKLMKRQAMRRLNTRPMPRPRKRLKSPPPIPRLTNCRKKPFPMRNRQAPLPRHPITRRPRKSRSLTSSSLPLTNRKPPKTNRFRWPVMPNYRKPKSLRWRPNRSNSAKI